MRIILASKSPRRKEILENIGINFEVMESNIDESVADKEEPASAVKRLAYMKAYNISQNTEKNTIIIGADTVVAVGHMILGKPSNEAEAYGMLKKLSNGWHNVYTGICLMDASSEKSIIDYECTSVKFRELADDDINAYIKTGEPNDKAGGYAIQGLGSLFIEKIEGCYFNVVGLPIFKLNELFIKEFGINLLYMRG
jgi:septum formation protein